MMALSACLSLCSMSSLSCPNPKTNFSSHHNSIFYKPFNLSQSILTTTTTKLSSSRSCPVIKPNLRIFCTASSEHDPAPVDNTIHIQLPRRSLLLQFTCNSCGATTKRLINRVAYERGTVFVQCAGCLQHHKLVDNLGLVVEYDFREETNIGLSADQG